MAILYFVGESNAYRDYLKKERKGKTYWLKVDLKKNQSLFSAIFVYLNFQMGTKL